MNIENALSSLPVSGLGIDACKVSFINCHVVSAPPSALNYVPTITLDPLSNSTKEDSRSSDSHRYNLWSLPLPRNLTFGLGEDPIPSRALKLPRGRESNLSKAIRRVGIEVATGIQTPIDRVLRVKGNPNRVTA